MKTIEATLSHLTDISIVEDLRKVLRDHIMQTMPYRNEAEAAAGAIQEAYEEALNEYEDAIRSYYVYLEATGPKLAHFWGHRFANQFLLWVEPGLHD